MGQIKKNDKRVDLKTTMWQMSIHYKNSTQTKSRS